MPAPAFRTRHGFSLVEALLATLLVASAIAGLAHLLAVAARQSATAEAELQALGLAQSKLEELRATPAPAWSPPGALTADHTGFVDAPDDRHVRRWAVAPLAADPALLLLQACVYRREHAGAIACVNALRFQP